MLMLLNSKQYILQDIVEVSAHIMWLSIKWVSSQTKESSCSPLLSPHEATSGMICPALSFPVWERYWQTGVSPVESNYDSRRWSTWHMRSGWRSWIRARVKPDPSWGPQWKDKSQQSQVAPGEIPAGHTENFLSDESDAALPQGPRRAVASPSLESFTIQWDIALRDLN